MTDADRQPPGFYGKVTGLGDFVHRRLPRSFRDPWDEWLRAMIAASKTQLGERWLNTYLTSPIWRWYLGPGPAQPEAWAGVLMPSVDRVGRYFPLTVAVAVDPANNPFRVAREHAAWFEQAETLALSTLEEGDFDLEAFSDQVAALGAIGVGEDEMSGVFPPMPWRVPLPSVDDLYRGLADLVAIATRERWMQCNLWWTDGSDLVEPSLLVCDGLPAEDPFIALLDGTWAERGWQVLGAQSAGDVLEDIMAEDKGRPD